MKVSFNFLKKFLFTGLLTILVMPALASDCVSKADMQDIASHFKQFSKYANSEFCYDGSQVSHLLSTIMFMRETAFSKDMKKSTDEVFSGRFSSSWYRYFIGRISDINIQKSCPKGVGAFVYGFGTTMYVCPMMLTDSFASLDRASVFMHEARHIDGFPHTTCSQGARKGLSGACDTRIADGGSYAVSVETYAQLARYATDVHPALKAYSMASAVTYADEAFEVPVRIQRDEQLLLMTEDKNLHALRMKNGVAELQALGQAPELGKIVPRGQHLVLVPTAKSSLARYMFTKNEGEISQVPGEPIAEYNSQTPELRSTLVDLHIGTQWVAKIYENKIRFTCNPNSDAVTEVQMPAGKTPVSILYTQGYNRASRSSLLLMNDGEAFEFGCVEGRHSPFLKASTNKVASGIKRAYKLGSQVIALTQDGRLGLMNGTQLDFLQTGLSSSVYEIAPKQFFSFLENN